MAEGDAARARAEARAILEGDSYRSRDIPRPFEGVLTWIGDRMRDLGDPIGDVLSTPQGVLASTVVIVVLAAVVVQRAVRRRTRLASEAVRAATAATGVDPDALEREADAAEGRGDLDLAVRLLFRAGVARLAAVGVAAARPGATTNQLVEAVGSADLAVVAAAFDEVAYGGRAATATDVATARALWPEVVTRARRAATAGTGLA